MPPDNAGAPARWRAPLTIVTVGGLILALLSGSVLLFVLLAPASRDYWVLAHWTMACVALVPFAIYQLRHYLRVRQHLRQTHYRVGLHSFFLMCGTVLSGLLLVTPLQSGTDSYSVVDLLHIFFGYAFTLLLSAHLTLVALRTLAAAPQAAGAAAAGTVRRFFVIATAIAVAGLAAMVALR
jgi:hypothetical protein